MKIRPWGNLEQILKMSDVDRWDFIGTLGTEERSITSWKYLANTKRVSSVKMLRITDFESRFTERANKLLSERTNEFIVDGGAKKCIQDDLTIDSELYIISGIINEFIGKSCGSIILDISSMPKRFFFVFIRQILFSEKIENFVICYNSPEKYSIAQDLAEEVGTWDILPGFGGSNETSTVLVVGVGFMVESLQQHIGESNTHDSIRLLMPFPAPFEVLRKSWDSIYRLNQNRKVEKFDLKRVAPGDMSSAYDLIQSISDEDPESVLDFAPFGPKPISAAMCIHSCYTNSNVYYPQPKIYNPEYSSGSQPIIQGYWIKHGGNQLYHD